MSTHGGSARELPFAATHQVRDACLCLHVQRAARALARRFDEALRPLDLTQGQFSLLTSLNRPEPPSIGSVAALLAMDRTTLTANLKPLERRRLVITAAGRALLGKTFPVWEKAHAETERLLTGISPDAMRGGLRALA
jgi:DNA-binding MarR family transcriptional regulator